MSEVTANIAEIECLHKCYLDLRENTPWQKRDGEECKAYHAWYDDAYVFFSSIDGLKGSDDFKTFANAEKGGNCFVLEHVYHSISASYKVLLKQAKKLESQGGKLQSQNQVNIWQCYH